MSTLLDTNSIVFASAKDLAEALIKKELSAVELSEAYIAQIERVNPLINAIMQVDKSRILQEAKERDKELQAGHVKGPLHGIPITIKDNLNTKNIITTGGSFAFAKNIPSEDATVVKRLRDAGAIILGKTNLPDFALSWETVSTAFGRTNNPYDLERTSGGSSGGEAAILATGGSALGIGTDSGGSIRLPAHYCGIAGLRTSRGTIPSTGHMPPVEGSPVLGVFANFNAIGPMARYVSDLLYVLPILQGSDNIDPYSETQCSNAFKFTLDGLKIALYSSVNGLAIDPEIETTLLNTAKMLEARGAIITDAEPPGLNDAKDIYCKIVGADGGGGIRSLLQELGYTMFPEGIKKSLDLMPKEPSLKSFLDAWIQWDLFRVNLLGFMRNYDLILCPATAFTALPHAESLLDPLNFQRENYLIPYSLMGWPSVVVRAGRSSNQLPIGIQIIAKHSQDYLALHTALAIESNNTEESCHNILLHCTHPLLG